MLSIGIAAAAGAEVAARLAPVLEREGFHALWVNDTPDADALEILTAAAGVTDRLVLATGVLPVDRRPAAGVAEAVARLGLPEDRLVLGIGAGQMRAGALDAVGRAAGEVRAQTGARVVVGALGPRMRRVGTQAADGLLLSWLDPETAARQTIAAHADAAHAHVALYVRTAVATAADARLRTETDRYAGFASYAANFARLGLAPHATVIDSAADRGSAVAAYESAVDEVVLRAVTAADTAEEYVAFAEHVARARSA